MIRTNGPRFASPDGVQHYFLYVCVESQHPSIPLVTECLQGEARLVNNADRASFATSALWRASICPECDVSSKNEFRSRLARPGATAVVGSTRVHPLSGSHTSHHACVSACRTRKKWPRSLYSPPRYPTTTRAGIPASRIKVAKLAA